MPNRYARPLLRCARVAILSKIYGSARICVKDLSYQSQRLRNFSGSTAMATSPQVNAPQFSAGVDEPALMRALEPLLASASRGGRWGLIPGGEGIERSFKFKTFAKTWVSQLLGSVPFFIAPFSWKRYWIRHLLYSPQPLLKALIGAPYAPRLSLPYPYAYGGGMGDEARPSKGK
ncbi:hypothetical protein ABKA04_006453 [Annulohypoxylon sp. FPYF3050]